MKKFQQQRISRQAGKAEESRGKAGKATPANCFSTYLMRRRLSTFCNLATYSKKSKENKKRKTEEKIRKKGKNRCQQSAKPTSAAAEKQLRLWLSIQTVYKAHTHTQPFKPSNVKYTPC